MVYQPSYADSMLESLGILSGFNVAEAIWEKYEQFAIIKMRDITSKLRGSFFYHKDLTPIQAAAEWQSIRPLIPVLLKLRRMIEPIDTQELQDFKSAALDFFDTVDTLSANLQDIANVNAAYELSHTVLANDWDSNEDKHWDNY